MLVLAGYYKADFEKRKWPWQAGYMSYKIAQHARGGHSHEESTIHRSVFKNVFDMFPLVNFANKRTIQRWLDEGNLYLSFSSSERDGGCRFKPASMVYKNTEKWDVEPVTDTMDEAMRMLHFFLCENGKDYDWAGIAHFKVNIVNQNPSKWYCAEICCKGKTEVGLWPKGLYAIHPSDSYNIQIHLNNIRELRLDKPWQELMLLK
jgi:hypothetical protein